MAKFHKAEKWRNNKKWFTTNLRKIYMASELAFCCFAFKNKLINPFSFLWNVFKSTKSLWLNKRFGYFWIKIITMISKNLAGLLTKMVLFVSYYFSKKLTFVSLDYNVLKKHLLKKLSKNLSEYISRQLKYLQHGIKSKTFHKKLFWMSLNVFGYHWFH